MTGDQDLPGMQQHRVSISSSEQLIIGRLLEREQTLAEVLLGAAVARVLIDEIGPQLVGKTQDGHSLNLSWYGSTNNSRLEGIATLVSAVYLEEDGRTPKASCLPKEVEGVDTVPEAWIAEQLVNKIRLEQTEAGQ